MKSSHHTGPHAVLDHTAEQAARVETRRAENILRGQSSTAAILSSLSVMVDLPAEDLPGISTDYSYTLTVASSPTPTAVVSGSPSCVQPFFSMVCLLVLHGELSFIVAHLSLSLSLCVCVCVCVCVFVYSLAICK